MYCYKANLIDVAIVLQWIALNYYSTASYDNLEHQTTIYIVLLLKVTWYSYSTITMTTPIAIVL